MARKTAVRIVYNGGAGESEGNPEKATIAQGFQKAGFIEVNTEVNTTDNPQPEQSSKEKT